MHKYIITRGKSRYVNNFKEAMEEVYLLSEIKDSNGNKIPMNVQLVMRPVQLWEVVYPEEHDARITNLIGNECFSHKGFMMKVKAFFVKLLGLEITKVKTTLTERPIPREHMSIIILGNKKDRRDGNGNELL